MLKLCSVNFSRFGRSLSGECDRANAADQDDVAAAAGEPSPVRHQRSCQGRKVPVRASRASTSIPTWQKRR